MKNETLSVRAYAQLEDMIVWRVLEPGEYVSERELVERTDLGRTPVREALQRLARGRMVEIHPGRGILIPPVSVNDELDILDLRAPLELATVRLACARRSAEDLIAIRGTLKSIEDCPPAIEEYMLTVRDTHEVIVTAAHNRYLRETIVPLQVLSRRFWLANINDIPTEIARAATLHTAILQAVLHGNTEDASIASEALHQYLLDFTLASVPPTLRDPTRSGAFRPASASRSDA
jgi:DNA-binding GntR family transcriptional regulator